MEFSLLQEEIFQKQLWDISAYTNSIACCEEIGTVATMTKLALHLHTPQFKYMSAYHVRWLLIDKKAPQFIEPPESVTDNVTSLTNFLVEHGMRENNVSFRSIQWSEGIVSNHNYAPLLVVLLTDGTVLFVDTCSKNVVQTTFGVDYVPTSGSDQTHTLSYLDESTYSIKLRECFVSLDCAAAYKQYCQGAGLNVFKYRIRCIAEHHVTGSSAHLVCFGACDRVTVWQVYYNEAGLLQINLLVECLLPECAVDFAVTSVLIVALATTPTVSTVAVVCGSNDGEVVTFELKLTQSTPNSALVGPVYSASQVTSRFAGRVHVSDAPIDRLQLSKDNNTTVTVFVGTEMHTVLIATLLNPVSTNTTNTLTTVTRLYPYGSVSAFETLPDLRALTSTSITDSTSITTNTTVSMGVLTTSTAGLLSTWSTTTTNSTPTLTPGQNILNKAKGYPIVGLATDPTRLVYTYLYKTPAMHSNSREVQLNIALRNPRSAIATSVSPFVAQDFAASVLSTARVLLYAIHTQHTNTTGAVKVPLSGLVLAYLHSLETDPCKQHYRTQIANLPHDNLTSSKLTAADKNKRKRAANTSANSSDSERASENESDSEPENTPSEPKQTIFLHKDQQLQKLQQQALLNKSVNSDSDSDASQLRSGAKSSGGPKGKKFLASQTRVRNTAKLYNRIEQLARPGNMEVVTLAVGTVFDAAVCVAYALSNNNHHNNHHSSNNSGNTGSSGVSSRTSGGRNTVSMEMLTAVDDNVCAIVKDMDLGDKIEVLFALPTEDSLILDLKRTLWQSLHVLLLASHRVRCVTRIGADWEDVPASLRQIMHTSYCYQALSRWLATTDASASNSDFQSVYFMSRVLGTESAAPESKALALAVQLQLLAYTSHDSSRTDGHSSDRSDSAVLHAMYGAEECGICGSLVDFQPTHDQIIETESAKQKIGPENTVSGSSVLYGICQGCSVRTERCCFSLRLLTTPPSKCVVSSTSNNSSSSGGYGGNMASAASRVQGQDSRVYACPVCTAATSVCLVRTVTAPNSVLRGTAPQALLCPYCAVLMQPL